MQVLLGHWVDPKLAKMACHVINLGGGGGGGGGFLLPPYHNTNTSSTSNQNDKGYQQGPSQQDCQCEATSEW